MGVGLCTQQQGCLGVGMVQGDICSLVGSLVFWLLVNRLDA